LMRSVQERVVWEIRTLRAMRRGLEIGPWFGDWGTPRGNGEIADGPNLRVLRQSSTQPPLAAADATVPLEGGLVATSATGSILGTVLFDHLSNDAVLQYLPLTLADCVDVAL